jgi:hypothetical protein
MRPFRPTTFFAFGLLAASPSWAATIDVPARQPNLQAAVAAAASGDTILFAPGTYLGGVWLDNKSLVFASRFLTTGDTSYIAQTVLSGLAVGYCPADPGCTGDATFDIGTHSGGAVIGLTITGAVKGVRSSSPVDVRYCHIYGTEDAINYSAGSGGLIANNVFRNQTDDGIDLNGRLAIRVIDNIVLNNHEDGIEFRMYPYTGPTLDIVVIGNQFIGNGSDGIQLIDSPDSSSRRIRVERNLFERNGRATVGCMPDQLTNEDFTGAPIAERVEFINNTVVGDFYGVVGGANTVAVNNILESIPNSAFRRIAGNSIAAHNLFWNNGLDNETSNVDLSTTSRFDPQLASDFRPKSGSLAIDAGVALFQWRGETIVNLSPTAYLGSAPDLGAFESGGSGPPAGSITLERRVATGSDDAEENAAGTMALSSSDLELMYDLGIQKVGMRFSNVTIPRGATISRAYVQFGAKEGQSEATALTIQGQAADNAGTFAFTAGNVSTRGRTAAAVSWTPAAWVAGEVGANQRTPDLAAVLQEVVNRAGWASGNALVLVVTGSGHRTAWAFDGNPAGAALLHIEVGGVPPPPPPNAAPVVSAGASQTITLPAEAVLNGTVTDDGLPSPPALTTQWSEGSGPGPVAFGDPGALHTGASFTTAGTYVLRLTASDGELSAAASVTIVVRAAPVNTAPVVDAGPGQTLTLPADAALNGTVTDDGLPSPPALTTQWSEGSGPGPVAFADAGAVDTRASFTAAGTYVLRLTASDGALSATDSVTIVVNAAPPPGAITLERRVTAGTDDVEENAAGTVLLYSSDIELVYDLGVQKVGLRFPNVTIPRGTTITRAYVQFEAKEAQSEATALTIQAQAADNAATFAATTGNVSSRSRTAAAVSWTPVAWAVGEVGPNQRTPDLSAVVQEVVNRAGWASGNALALVVTGSGHRTAWSFEGKPAGAALLHVETGGGPPPPPSNAAPVVDAGPSQALTLPADAALNGTVTDDGLPSPPALTTQWSEGSGPGLVAFADAGAVDTRASFTTPGTYVLRLTASDGALSAGDSVTIVVTAATPPPPTGSITLERRVASVGTDDVEEDPAGTVLLYSTDIELVYDISLQKVGLRFTNIAIPRGATITRAYVQFEAKESQSEATSLRIQAQAADNAATFAATTGNVSSRSRTAAAVSWAPAPWAAGELGANQRTPDLSAVVQEVVNRAGWASGNALALVVTGTGHRTAWAYEGKATGGALLHIEAGSGSPPPPSNAAPVVDAGANQTLTLPADAALNGTVTDDGLPSPPALTTQWSEGSGPGPVAFADAGAVDTRASFATPGTYVLRLTASDGALSARDSVTIVVKAAAPPPTGSITLERRVAAGTDDVEENAAGTVLLYSSDIELVYDSGVQKIGLRFANVAIPRGATITRAFVQFEAREAQSEATALTIQGQAADNAGTFTATTANVTSRARTAASVSWAPAPWAVGEVGENQRTPDLSAVVQEVVSRAGWASGNALAFVVTGTGHRTAWAFDGNQAGVALLHIEASGPVAQSQEMSATLEERPRSGFALHGVMPVPARDRLSVEFSLGEGERARLEVLDVSGRRVTLREVGPLGPGRHRIDVGDRLPAGLYFVRLTQGPRVGVAKALIVK